MIIEIIENNGLSLNPDKRIIEINPAISFSGLKPTYPTATTPLSDDDKVIVRQGAEWKEADKSQFGGGLIKRQISELVGNRIEISTSNVGKYYSPHFYIGKAGGIYTYSITESGYASGYWTSPVQDIIMNNGVFLKKLYLSINSVRAVEDAQLIIGVERRDINGVLILRQELSRINLDFVKSNTGYIIELNNSFVLLQRDVIKLFIHRFKADIDADVIARGLYGNLIIDE